MDVSLTPELEQFVQEIVAAGRYSSTSDVVRAGLRKLEEQERWTAFAKAKIARGLDDIAAHNASTRDDFLAEAKERRKQRP